MTRRKEAEAFDLDLSVRTLARALIALDGLRSNIEPWRGLRFANEHGSLSERERSAFQLLAVRHLQRHSVSRPRRGELPRCSLEKQPCRAFGLASAIYVALDSDRARRSSRHVTALRETYRDAIRSLRRLIFITAAYRKRCAEKHQRAWRLRHGHEQTCVLPALVALEARDLAQALEVVDATGLATQLPVDVRDPRRRTGLLSNLQLLLYENGFSQAEIVRLVGDGPGDARARLRKRLERAGAARDKRDPPDLSFAGDRRLSQSGPHAKHTGEVLRAVHRHQGRTGAQPRAR